jgi:hypothetical protein
MKALKWPERPTSAAMNAVDGRHAQTDHFFGTLINQKNEIIILIILILY